jgi:hypothetical protein
MKKMRKKRVHNTRKSRKHIDIKKTLPYKLLIIFLIILIVLLVIYAFLKSYEKKPEEEIEDEIGLGSMGLFWPPGFLEEGIIKRNCSDKNLKEIWDYCINESSDGITIVSDRNASYYCNASLMYKVLEGNIAYFSWLYIGRPYYGTGTLAYSGYGNFTPEFIQILENTTSENVENFFIYLWNEGLQRESRGFRNISSAAEADNEYHRHFKITAGSWQYNSQIPAYEFEEGTLEYGGNFSTIYVNTTLNVLAHTRFIKKPVNLTQINDIPNLEINSSDYHYRVLDLNDYFDNLGYEEQNLTINYAIHPAGEFSVLRNSLDKNSLDFNTTVTLGGDFEMNLTLGYPWLEDVVSNNFNVSIKGCVESDNGQNRFVNGTTRNLTTTMEDVCEDNVVLNEFYCEDYFVRNVSINCGSGYECRNGSCVSLVNHAPEFKDNRCGDIEWNKNTNRNRSDNLVIERDGEDLTLIPESGWVGTGYFYIYANDTREETRGKVDFRVKEPSSNGGNGGNGNGYVVNTTPPSNDSQPVYIPPERLVIKSPNPSGITITMFENRNRTFSIANTNYDSIKWFLNNTMVGTNSRSYTVTGLEEGNYTLKVEVKKGSETASKTWNLVVEGEEMGKEFLFNPGVVIFWTIIIVLVIVIMLIAWLLVIEKTRKKKPLNLGFGVMGEQKKFGFSKAGARNRYQRTGQRTSQRTGYFSRR